LVKHKVSRFVERFEPSASTWPFNKPHMERMHPQAIKSSASDRLTDTSAMSATQVPQIRHTVGQGDLSSSTQYLEHLPDRNIGSLSTNSD